DITDVANFTWAAPDTVPGEPTATRLPGAPVGKVTLGGIPFDIASNTNGKQAWHANIAANGGPGQVSITNFVNIYGATEVYSLVNTWCGQPGPDAYAWFVFTGSKGAVYTNYLIGGVDICDYNFGPWENIITSPLTVNVFSCPSDNWGNPGRLDMQKIPLPVLVDNGGPLFQRVVLDGLTVKVKNTLPLTIESNNGQINLTWPAAIGATLQMNNVLSTTDWTDYTGTVLNLNGTNTVTIAPSGDKMFFRLQKY
ncbi:MAG TPA: hypothetical protein PLW02_01645, partial [Verrucomicrobiota bacterium]|nr:hypothetical protein [Verrucomicrobiota bacterium]